MITVNQRPGVYSRYDVSSSGTAPLSLKYAAVAARASGGAADGTVYRFKSYNEACEVFLPDEDGVFMRATILTLFECGVSEILACPVGADYESAFSALRTAENIGAVVTDACESPDLEALKTHVTACSLERRERLGFCGIDDPSEALDAASLLNCERIVLCCPSVSSLATGSRSSVLAAAALAGKILASSDPAANLNGSQFLGITMPEPLNEPVIQELLANGVTVFESVGGVTECIRALTTRTSTAGAPDRGLAGVNTILIIDNVIETMRATLKSRLGGGRVGGAPLESIRSQAAVVLSEKMAEGLLASFSPPRCYPHADDPAVCVVEMGFKVAHVLSHISVTAHIEV